MFRTGTGKDVDFPDDPSQFGIVHFFEFGTCDSRFADADVQTFADDTRRFDMVACDHLDDDACVMALVDRKERFLTGRVDDAEEPQHDQPSLDIAECHVGFVGRHFFGGNGQRSLSGRGDFTDFFMPVMRVDRAFSCFCPFI